MRPWVLIVLSTACAHRGTRAAEPHPSTPCGLYWARIADVPDGMRVAVWLDSDGERLRGSYASPPWSGEIEGRRSGANDFDTDMIEHGAMRALGTRTRHARLHWDRAHGSLAGTDATGGAVQLLAAGFPSAELRPGLWIARWTGLPPGLAVETRLERTPDGHYRATYQYQGAGGVRDGSFDGTLEHDGALTIRWTEFVQGGPVARGAGRLSPSLFGLRGSFGIEGSVDNTGEWELEPIEP